MCVCVWGGGSRHGWWALAGTFAAGREGEGSSWVGTNNIQDLLNIVDQESISKFLWDIRLTSGREGGRQGRSQHQLLQPPGEGEPLNCPPPPGEGEPLNCPPLLVRGSPLTAPPPNHPPAAMPPPPYSGEDDEEPPADVYGRSLVYVPPSPNLPANYR